MPLPPPRLLHGIDRDGQRSLTRAWEFCLEYLGPLKRRDGHSYAEHGAEVAAALREISSDPELLATAFLHDLLMHPEGERLLRKSPLTKYGRRLCEEMHTLRRLHIDAETADLDKALTSFASDQSLLALRMAHRLNDIRHIERFGQKLQRDIANETLHMYGAIAGRLGMHAWRHEMEDVCFKLLQPASWEAMAKQFSLHAKNDERCLDHLSRFLKRRLKAQGIAAQLFARKKAYYSTYRKMVLKRRRFD
jgi:guanosine-3',5'-bis(diphosphate) 3'-pyrophosphohydrolase